MKKYATSDYVYQVTRRVSRIDERVFANENEIAELKKELQVLKRLYKKSGFLYQLLHWR